MSWWLKLPVYKEILNFLFQSSDCAQSSLCSRTSCCLRRRKRSVTCKVSRLSSLVTYWDWPLTVDKLYTSLWPSADAVLHMNANEKKNPNANEKKKIVCSPSLAFDSAHVKYGVWTCLTANNITSKLAYQFQWAKLITPTAGKTGKHYWLDSEDDFRSGCRNVGHQKQLFLQLPSPGRSHYTNCWFSWVQTSYNASEVCLVTVGLHLHQIKGILSR